jgi:hypothetical protein
MLQAGRSQVRFLMTSLDISIDLILPTVLWPWSRLSLLTKVNTRNLPGVKGGWPARKAHSLTASCEPID